MDANSPAWDRSTGPIPHVNIMSVTVMTNRRVNLRIRLFKLPSACDRLPQILVHVSSECTYRILAERAERTATLYKKRFSPEESSHGVVPLLGGQVRSFPASMVGEI